MKIRTEYIGKLNALYVGDKNCLEELITAYDEKDKEIERLQKENQILMNSMVTEAHTKETKEIERLNNIINELEKELKERYLDFKDSECEEIKASAYEDISILERLKKLRGSEKDE